MSSSKADFLIPGGLLTLSFIPVLAGTFRVVQLASGVESTPDKCALRGCSAARGAPHRQFRALLHLGGVPICPRFSASPIGLASRGRPLAHSVWVHCAWMIRAYALGLGVGTQALTHIP